MWYSALKSLPFCITIFYHLKTYENMDPLIYTLIIGALAGWLAGYIRQGYGFGLLGNIVVGIVGAFIGTWVFRQLGISIGSGLANSIITAVIGALLLLFLIGLIRSSR